MAIYDNRRREEIITHIGRKDRIGEDEGIWHSPEEAFNQLEGRDQAVLIRYINHGDLRRAIEELGLKGQKLWSTYDRLIESRRFADAKKYVAEKYMSGSDVRKEMFEVELMNLVMLDIGMFTETREEEERVYNNKTKNWEQTGNIVKINGFKDMESIPDWAMKGIESVEFERDGQIKKLKLYNKISAIETLAKLKKWVGTQEGVNDIMAGKLEEISRSAESIAKQVESKLRHDAKPEAKELLDSRIKAKDKN